MSWASVGPRRGPRDGRGRGRGQGFTFRSVEFDKIREPSQKVVDCELNVQYSLLYVQIVYSGAFGIWR